MFGALNKKLTACCAAMSLCASPAIASATAAPSAPAQISPMVALSIFGSQASATALCGASAPTTRSTSAAASAPVGGCVLPVIDAPPPVAGGEALPIILSAEAGLGIAPILLGLSTIAVVTALAVGRENSRNDLQPISVN